MYWLGLTGSIHVFTRSKHERLSPEPILYGSDCEKKLPKWYAIMGRHVPMNHQLPCVNSEKLCPLLAWHWSHKNLSNYSILRLSNGRQKSAVADELGLSEMTEHHYLHK